MASEWAFLQHEVAILKRMIGPGSDDLSVTAARAILKLDFQPRDHAHA